MRFSLYGLIQTFVKIQNSYFYLKFFQRIRFLDTIQKPVLETFYIGGNEKQNENIFKFILKEVSLKLEFHTCARTANTINVKKIKCMLRILRPSKYEFLCNQ